MLFQSARWNVFALLCLMLLVAGCSTGRQTQSDTVIRIMTWNIHHAEGSDGIVDVDRIAKLIKDEHVDIVALQEIDRGVPRSKKIDIITSLADKTDLTYAFGKTLDYQGGEYGNGFLTRFPILEERNFLFRPIQGHEQRGVLLLVLETQGEEFVVANTHLDHQAGDSAREIAVGELRPFLETYASRPVVLCGDMNAVPGSTTWRGLSEFLSDAWERVGSGSGFTYPGASPEKRIDYIFSLKKRVSDSLSSSLQLFPVAAKVIRSQASDHLPLIVEFRLTTEH